MNTFRQIPLHMLLLAGLLGTAEAKENEQPAAPPPSPLPPVSLTPAST